MAKVKKLLELTSIRAIKIATGEIFSILDLVFCQHFFKKKLSLSFIFYFVRFCFLQLGSIFRLF